jgi:ribosomal protein L32E
MKTVIMRSSQYNKKFHNHVTVKWEVRKNEVHKIRKQMSYIYRNVSYKYPEKYIQTNLLPSGFNWIFIQCYLVNVIDFPSLSSSNDIPSTEVEYSRTWL